MQYSAGYDADIAFFAPACLKFMRYLNIKR